MRRMSFMLTMPQMRARTKTVTRRLGWLHAHPGDIVRPAERTQGIKPGQVVELLDPIQFTNVRREPLDVITPEDVVLEGFPDMSVDEFIAMFCRHMRCPSDETITRIAFDHLGVR